MKKVFLFLAAVLILCNLNAQSKIDIGKFNSKKSQCGFIENKGQIVDQNRKANSEVIYLLSDMNGMNVQLKMNSFSYDTYKAEALDTEKDPLAINMQPNMISAKDYKYSFHRVDIELVGANANPEIIAEQPSTSYVNYYNATSKSKATNLHNYKKITYKNIYSGIDMIFEAQASKDKSFEYSFIVHPGADANQIKLHYKGAKETRLNENKINIDVVNGRFTENIPASWVKETNTKLTVSYKNIANDIYSFNVPAYNTSQTLIIDPNPNLDWATYFGGSGNETGTGVVCNTNGDPFITGYTNSTATIATTGANQSTFGGGTRDAFVAKFDNNGAIIWATYFGGSGDDQATGITCDAEGNVIIVGVTNSTDIAVPGAFQAAIAGLTDAFVAKFNTSGILKWATYYGDSGDDKGTGVACDASSNVFISGITNSTVGIASPSGAYQAAFGGGLNDAFLVKFDSVGARKWATYYGGSGDDQGKGVACDAGGNIFVTGITNSTNAMTSIGANQGTFGGGAYDAFLVKFSPTCTRSWGTYYGGTGDDQATGVACYKSGTDALITGYTDSPNAIAVAPYFQGTLGGGIDAFAAKFKVTGVLKFGTYYGGAGNDYSTGITCDLGGTYFAIAGYTTSNNAISSNGSYQSAISGGTITGDAFAVKFDYTDASIRKWGTYFGGEGDDKGTAVAFDGGGNVFITGQSNSTDDIATTGAYQTVLGGTDDAILARFSTCELPADAGTIYGPAPICLPISGKINYTVAPITNATEYIWTVQGVDTTSPLNTDSVNVNGYTDGQTLTISVYGKNACGIGLSKSLNIIFHTTPPPPVISFVPGPDSITLTSSAATGNQWYAGPSTTGTNQTCVAFSNGDYHATVTVNGCTSLPSNILHITHVGIDENNNNTSIKVYPNPVSNELIIENTGSNDKLYYEILNSIGQVVYSGNVIGKTTIETTNLSSGVYLLKLDNGKTINFKKIVKD